MKRFSRVGRLSRTFSKPMLWRSGLRLGTLNGYQRFLISAMRGKPDKIPLALGEHTTLMPSLYNVGVWDYLNNPQLAVDLEIRFCEEFGIDADISGTRTYIKFGCGPEIGPEWKQTGIDMPGCVGRLINQREDIQKIGIPDQPIGYFKNYLEEMSSLNERIGTRVYLTSRVLSPFSAACFLRGFQEVVMDAQLKPDFYKDYMDHCVDLSKFWGKHVLKTGVMVAALLEIYGMPDLVGAKFYHNHIAPYNAKISDHFRGRVRDSMKTFIGEPDDLDSQKRARDAYDSMFERETPDKHQKALKSRLPGMPACIAITGETLLDWSGEDILTHIKKGLDIMIEDGIYPYVFLLSVAPRTNLDKLKAIRELLNNYKV